MVYRYSIITVLVILSAGLIVGDGFLRTAQSLDKLNSKSLRNVTGAEGLSVNPNPSVSLTVPSYSQSLQGSRLAGTSDLEQSSATGSNRTKIALTGNASGIRTNYLMGTPARTQSGLTSVDSAGPFSLNLTVVPALPSQSNGAGISLRMPELSGSVGGDFMINSRQQRFSAGRISIGNLHTPVKMDLHTGP
jgi:hypothetical protein